MSINGRIFSALYDRLMAKTEARGLSDQRRALLADVKGDVLEIGGGTGANLRWYGSGVASLTITEPEKAMLTRLQRKATDAGVKPRVLRAPAEDLPFDDASFDVAVSTLVLCTVDDQPRALRELHRVLRPGGRLLFLEHVRSDDPKLARWQDRLVGINRVVAAGCTCNRSTLDSITAAGFSVDTLQRDSLAAAPPWVRPLIIGAATAA